MAELNLKQITDKLNSEFASDVRKLVFWYDANAEFVDDVDTLELENAKVLHLEPDNQFYIKYFLEREDTTTNYLVYAPFAKPDIRNNHLADTIRYSKEFFADRASLIALDLGIDERYKPVIQHYIKFFANKDRTQKFYDLEIENFNKSTIEVALMSVLCKNKTASFEEVLRSVLNDDELADNKHLREFEKYDLLTAFWQQAEVAFGYSDPKPTLEKLIITMFVTYASKSIHTDMPQAWKAFISYKSGNIIAFMDNLMNSYLYGSRFDEISDITYNAINGKNYLDKMEVETLVDCNIFAGVDEILINWIIGRLENEDIGAKLDGKIIPELCIERRKKHFGKDFRREYFILQNAFDIIADGNYHPVSGIRNLVREYTEQAYKIDRYYRYFYYYYDSLEDTTKFEKIRELVENIYTNDYLNQITINWNNEFADADGETGLVKQRDFFSKYINNSKDRVVVIISDAFRYEVAHTLFKKMMADEKCNVTISAMQSVLPSYTPLGMASLLPHKTIEYTDSYDVLVDRKACTSTKQRGAILREYKANSKCIQFDAFKNMKQADLRSVFTGQDVVYIYHNQVDARGDAAKTENEVFIACEETINEIFALIKRIASQANTYHFIVTADHGFIYKRDKIQATDKISGAASKSNSVGQRYSISTDGVNAEGVCHLTVGKVLGNKDERIISFPLASDIFKVAGAGQNFVHGGCSPQEMLVPVIDVKVDKGKKETSLAEIALVSLTTKITNLITTLDFVQTEPVSDVVKETSYRVYFVSDNNEKISNENIVIADKKDKDSTKRMFRLRFNFKNKKYDKSQKYYLVAYDDKNDIEVLRHEIIMDIAFADDFGFFE
ncbi:MAG: BREX-1 system phosphatase PglZ type A [Oscillospiraceae bacterium]